MTVPFAFQSTELFGLLAESLQLVRLIATEKRDLKMIRNNYRLRQQYLENIHLEVLAFMEHAYRERSLIISAISENTKLLITVGEFDAAQHIMNRLTDFIAANSPLKTALDLRSGKSY